MTKQAEHFAQWLDITMSNREMTGSDLAGKIRFNTSAISRWRSGQKVPGMDAIWKLAEVFEVDPLRLAATAGRLPEGATEPLPIPPVQHKHRNHVRSQINKITGITRETKQRLLEVYDAEARGDGPT